MTMCEANNLYLQQNTRSHLVIYMSVGAYMCGQNVCGFKTFLNAMKKIVCIVSLRKNDYNYKEIRSKI